MTELSPENAALIEQFKSGLDADSAAAMATRLTTAESALAELQEKPDLSADLAAATARAETAETRAATLETENGQLGRALDAAKTEKAKAVAVEKAGAPRKFGPIAESKVLDRDALKAAIADADDVEIAFSDGRKEVKGVGVFAVSGEAWKDHAIGLMLTEPVTLVGPTAGQASFVIEGYALVLDGKAVAYTEREPLTVAAGANVRLENDIHF